MSVIHAESLDQIKNIFRLHEEKNYPPGHDFLKNQNLISTYHVTMLPSTYKKCTGSRTCA